MNWTLFTWFLLQRILCRSRWILSILWKSPFGANHFVLSGDRQQMVNRSAKVHVIEDVLHRCTEKSTTQSSCKEFKLL